MWRTDEVLGHAGGPFLRDLVRHEKEGPAGRRPLPLGAPLGLQHTVTAGIVSALRDPLEDPLGSESVPLLGGAVQTDAAAAAAGLRAGERVVSLGTVPVPIGGDILVAVDGLELVTTGELRAYIENRKRPREVVVLTVLREGVLSSATVTLGVRPSSQPCL